VSAHFHIFDYGSEGTGKNRLTREALEVTGMSYVDRSIDRLIERTENPALATSHRLEKRGPRTGQLGAT